MTFIPAYPRIEATIRENKTGELTINGTSRPIVAADLARLRAGVIARCAVLASQVHRPVRVHVVDVAGTYAIAIHPDAFVQVLDATGTALDLVPGADRTISSSPCRQCSASTPLSARICASCQVHDPHDVQAAPQSTDRTPPAVLHLSPARAEPGELLARWSQPATVQTAGGRTSAPSQNEALDEAVELTVVMAERQRIPAPVLHFANGQTLTVTTSALVGRKPVPNEGERVASLFHVDEPDRTVSKTHFRIDWHDNQLRIVDRNSANGIVVTRGLDNPTTITPLLSFELYDKDRVLIGDQIFTVQVNK